MLPLPCVGSDAGTHQERCPGPSDLLQVPRRSVPGLLPASLPSPPWAVLVGPEMPKTCSGGGSRRIFPSCCARPELSSPSVLQGWVRTRGELMPRCHGHHSQKRETVQIIPGGCRASLCPAPSPSPWIEADPVQRAAAEHTGGYPKLWHICEDSWAQDGRFSPREPEQAARGQLLQQEEEQEEVVAAVTALSSPYQPLKVTV